MGTLAQRGAARTDSDAVLKRIRSGSLCIWHALMQHRRMGNACALTKLNFNVAQGWSWMELGWRMERGAALGYPGPICAVRGSPGAAVKPGPRNWGHPPTTQPNPESPPALRVAAARAQSAHRREGRSCRRGIKVNLLCDMDLDYRPVLERLDGLNVPPEGRAGREREMLKKRLATHLTKKKHSCPR